MTKPICIIHNDKFTISFEISNQMFYHLNRLLSQYADEVYLPMEIDEDLNTICITIKQEETHE